MSIGGSEIVFVAGVHGVGKSTLCADAASRGGYVHLTASSIIRAQKQSGDEVGTKTVADVAGNQDLLIDGLRATVESGRKYILDGHLALWGNENTPELVPYHVIKEIAPKGIVLIVDDPAVIEKRLVERDGGKYTAKQIHALQEKELAYAQMLALQLEIPYIEVPVKYMGDLLIQIDVAAKGKKPRD